MGLVRRPMSALGHKRTFAVQIGMSAFSPKADMCGAKRNVRFVPIADIQSRLFDDLVGAGKQHRRHGEADRFRGLEVDDQLEFGRHLHRQI